MAFTTGLNITVASSGFTPGNNIAIVNDTNTFITGTSFYGFTPFTTGLDITIAGEYIDNSTFIPGTSFSGFTTFIPGTTFTYTGGVGGGDENNVSQVSTGIVTYTGSTLSIISTGENNVSQVSTGTVDYTGSILSIITNTGENQFNQDSTGTVTYTGSILSIQNDLAIASAKVTKQEIDILVGTTDIPKVRITKQKIETLIDTTDVPQVNITKQFIEVLYTRNPAYIAPTKQYMQLYVHT